MFIIFSMTIMIKIALIILFIRLLLGLVLDLLLLLLLQLLHAVRGTVDTEIKNPPGGSPGLSKTPSF